MTADIKSFMRLDMTNHLDEHVYELIEGFRLTDPPLYKLFIDGYSVSYSKYIIGPRREKTCLREFLNNIGADQPAHPRRPACASAQTDQRLCYSLIEKNHI